MRSPAILQVAAGVGIVLILISCLGGVEGRKQLEQQQKKNELTKPETNKVQQKPTLLNFFRRLLPEKTMDNLRAAITAKPKQKARSIAVEDAKSRALKSNKKKPVKEMKKKVVTTTVAPKKIKLPTRFRTAVNPKTTTTMKTKTKITPKIAAQKTNFKPPQIRKQKTGKELKSRQNSRSSSSPAFIEDKPPAPEEMQVLTHSQKSNRLRQELIRETEGNCLAKILCGTTSKPKEKVKNTMISDSAYLIREFFNIFDFTIDDVREEIQEMDDVNQKAFAAEEAEKKKKEQEKQQNDVNDDEEEDDDTDDSEEDEIYRKSPTSEVPKKKKYTTRNPANKESQKTKPLAEVVEEEKKKQMEVRPAASQLKTKRPKPINMIEMTTAGDLVLMQKPTSTYNSNMDRLGEVVTPSTLNMLTSTIVSTSMKGSATLKPEDTLFSIPLKTNGRDDADDDDEEDDNPKYEDDNEEDSSTFHRVTLEELVGDINLSPGDFHMIRRGRSMKIPVSVKNVTGDKYLQTKLRQMNVVSNEFKKLKIAQRIAKSMREPRQCRQFQQVAKEVLQTCPLTTEVIRFFNTNLKNGTTLEVKKIPPGGVSSEGLVVLKNDPDTGAQQTFFVDNSPKINTRVQSDLKNPSLPGSHNPEEVQYPIYEKRPNPNPQNANLNQFGKDVTKNDHPKFGEDIIKRPTSTAAPKTEDSEEEQDDEDNSDEDEDEEEDDIGRREDDNDDEEEYEEFDDAGSSEDDTQYDDGESDEEDGSDDDSEDKKKQPQQNKKVVNLNLKQQGGHNQLQGSLTNQPNVEIVLRKPPKVIVPPKPTLPPGIIRVYGIPQPSFDREFGQVQIGQPVNLFGDEFLDSPPYKRRKPSSRYGHRTSKKAKTDEDDELEVAENVPFNARIPKHPPLEPSIVHDGDEGSDEDNKYAYENPKKHPTANHGKPLGGIKGGDDDDDDKKNTSAERSAEKKDGDDKDGDDKDGDDNSAEAPIQITTIDEPPFSPSVQYQLGGSQQPSPHNYGGPIDFYGGAGGLGGGDGSPSYNQYGSQPIHQYHHSPSPYQNGPVRRPHSYRPLVRPIQIMPDANVPITGMNFRPSRDYMRPGRLYPLYHGRK